jgi:His-Xaa-Ser system protein HxsD
MAGKNPKIVDNLEIHPKKVIVSVNPKFYNLDVVYSSLYNFLEKCYCKVQGDLEEEILVELKPKEKQNLENIGRQFNNELINYAAVAIRGIKTQDMRLEIVKRALSSHQPEELGTQVENWEDDPEGISIPWEEKYGKGERLD